jgi:hypothetical protein
MTNGIKTPLAGNQCQGFVIFAMARTGSGYLVKLLDSHPHIESHRELFHAQHIGIFLDKEIPGSRDFGLVPTHRQTFLKKWSDCINTICQSVKLKDKDTIRGAVLGSGSGAAKFALWTYDELRKKLEEVGTSISRIRIDIYPGEREFLEGFTAGAKGEIDCEFNTFGIKLNGSVSITQINEEGVALNNNEIQTADFIIVTERTGGPCPDLDISKHKGLRKFLDEARFYDDVSYRDADPEAFLRRFFLKSHNNMPVVGFKLMLVQNEMAKKLCAEDTALKKIVLYRNNLLASFSSDQVMKKARKSFMYRDEVRNSPLKIEFTANAFERYREKVDNLYEQLRQMRCADDNEWLYLEYKELNEPHTHERLAEFLGVGNTKRLRSTSQKVNPGSIIDRFTNSDEAWRYLKSIGRENWCEE